MQQPSTVITVEAFTVTCNYHVLRLGPAFKKRSSGTSGTKITFGALCIYTEVVLISGSYVMTGSLPVVHWSYWLSVSFKHIQIQQKHELKAWTVSHTSSRNWAATCLLFNFQNRNSLLKVRKKTLKCISWCGAHTQLFSVKNKIE